MRLPCEDTPHRPTPENSLPRYIVALYAETRTQKKATAQRRPHGQIAARWGELRFGLRSESWAYRLGFIRTDWSGWAGLRGAHTPPCGGWSEVRGDGQKNKKRPPEGDRLVLQSHVCKNLWFS